MLFHVIATLRDAEQEGCRPSMEATSPRPAWRKSSHSSSQGDDCVELAKLGDFVGVRDSKNPHGPKLMVDRDDFAALLTTLKR
jgi:hypothetical protein